MGETSEQCMNNGNVFIVNLERELIENENFNLLDIESEPKMTKKSHNIRKEILKGLKEIIKPEDPFDDVFLCVYDEFIHSNDELSLICVNCGSRICKTCYETFVTAGMTTCPNCDIHFSDYAQILSLIKQFPINSLQR